MDMRAEEYLKLTPAKVPANTPPMLLVVIDTEEEFDWSAPHDRNATAVTAIQEIHRAQAIFDHYGIRPVYAIDYPVAAEPASVSMLREICDSGRAEIAVHL